MSTVDVTTPNRVGTRHVKAKDFIRRKEEEEDFSIATLDSKFALKLQVNTHNMMKSDSDPSDPSLNEPSFLVSTYRKFSTKLQHWLDCITPHTGLRWLAWCIVLALYLIRTFILQGWYIVTYAVGIFMLNQFIAFLTPKIDPAMRDYEEDGLSLPTKVTEEFRPFMRQLPEFKFWYSTLKALLIGMLCTMFDFFNIPVFWPILVLYFIILFTVTMKKQIRHMIKYKYIPFTHGKAQYRGKADTGKIVGS